MNEMLRKLNDLSIDQKKISSSDNFELVYLRHKYFRRSTNPSQERLNEFEEMICNISNKIYYRNIMIFKIIGFEEDDLRNIGRVNTVSFISMNGLKENPKLMEKFILEHKSKFGEKSSVTDKDIFLKECYVLSKFLKQRLYEVANFCQIKSASIIGDKMKKTFFLGDPSKNPNDEDLLMSPKSFGYKKITEMEFKRLQKENNSDSKTDFLTKEGKVARIVLKNPDFLAAKDFYINVSDNESLLDPEEIMIQKENFLLMKKLSVKNKTKSSRKRKI
jgi:hypothetical protein